ncbi:TonB-dependent receptor plug domain-containing protein [Erythrobacter crassostreae]|uniref:TonB-dependent receptor n=1 Tax=Erythrobacter crassostreae TaxID=2828328 RepID=A0A9X1F2Y6_9SPHN|nr:TonB-dependent receptor [Erythrobacter crassostrea]MBV7259335.1 TonB-dependent receptor [Erythrobacter crassostrea]
MKNTLYCGAAIAAFGLAAPVLAQDVQADYDDAEDDRIITLQTNIRIEGILVSANRDESSGYIEDYTGSATIIERRDINNRQTRDIADALRDVPGVAVSSVAGQTQIRLRGSEANHVLVLVDGIEVSDPFAGEFDIGTLQAEIGSKVEVLRGPQSALYGADAIGGIVAYESARGAQVNGFGARVEAGTNNTINGSAQFGIGDYDADLAINATVVSTDGEPNARGGTRDLARDSYTVSGKGSVRLGEALQARVAARFIRTEGDFNNSDFDTTSPTFGLIIDAPETRFENEAIYALAGLNLATFDEAWTHDISAQLADINRDTFGAFGRSSGSEGDRLKASYVSAAQIDNGNDSHFLTFAVDWEREQFRNNDPFGIAFSGTREIENVGLVGEYRFAARSINLSAAIRHDINDRFADETTFRFGAAYDLTDSTRVRASAGSGIKNPGFFELFGFFDGQFIGNENLQPEKSTGWEVGVDQTFADGKANISLTYFDSELENEIFTIFPAPTFIATPANRQSVSSRRGVEISANADLGGGFSFDAAYSYLDAEEDGVEEVRRPDHIASAALNWTASDEGASATLVVRHNGETEDLAFTDPSFIPVRETLDDFTLVNLAGEFRLTDGVSLFGRVENLFDETYEQVFSFVSPGRTAIAGIRATF